MHLSKRLQAVVNYVTKGNTVADIGCDHAKISIYLIRNEIAPRVIAMDINKGPLKRAQNNIERYGFQDRIETRLSDGAAKLEEGEVDTILIAGMGGALMVKILSERENVIRRVKELVLQPQSEIAGVRRYLHSIGFRITEETMLKDDGKIYVAMKAVMGTEKYDKEIDYLFGKKLLEAKNETLKEFLEIEYKKHLLIIQRLEQQPITKVGKRLEEIKNETFQLEEGMKCYGR